MDTRHVVRALALSVLALASAGCASNPPAPTPASGPDPVMTRLTQVAEQISADERRMTEVMTAATRVPIKTYATPASGPLAIPITFKWAGPIERVTEAIVGMVGNGYRYKQVGRLPLQPLIVDVDVTNKPAFEVLADIGWQAGVRAGITVNTEERLIQLTFVGNER